MAMKENRSYHINNIYDGATFGTNGITLSFADEEHGVAKFLKSFPAPTEPASMDFSDWARV